MDIRFRQIERTDIELHREFIYVALWDHPEDPRRPRSVLDSPRIEAYYREWGKCGDIGMFAVVNGEPVGFIQLRVKESVTVAYAELPELSISVFPQYQKKGIATRLFDQLLPLARVQFSGLRLGVNPKNTVAIKLYQRLDFDFYACPESGYPQMVLNF